MKINVIVTLMFVVAHLACTANPRNTLSGEREPRRGGGLNDGNGSEGDATMVIKNVSSSPDLAAVEKAVASINSHEPELANQMLRYFTDSTIVMGTGEKRGEPKIAISLEKACNANTESGDYLAEYMPKSMTVHLCRGYFTKDDGTERAENERVRIYLHELTHFAFDLVKCEFSTARREEEAVQQLTLAYQGILEATFPAIREARAEALRGLVSTYCRKELSSEESK